MIYGWTIDIGDPGLLGWTTVAAYWIAAGLCWLAMRSADVRMQSGRFWLSLCVLLAFLGVNKQLDLQSLLTAVARHFTMAWGWYENRRALQLTFIALLMAVSALIALQVGSRLRHRNSAARIASFGFAGLLIFIAVRAASFHHLDMMLTTSAYGVRLNHVLELGGIGVIAAGALREVITPRSGSIFAAKPTSP